MKWIDEYNLIKVGGFMSKGISIYYKLIGSDNDKLTYGYSGADTNKEYDKESLLKYDGMIEISVSALKNKNINVAFADNDIKVLRECKYEWHQPRIINGEATVGLFAMKVAYTIFSEFNKNFKIVAKDAIIY